MNTSNETCALIGGIPATHFIGRQVKIMGRCNSIPHGGITLLKEVKGDAVRHRPHNHKQDEWAMASDIQPFWGRNPDLKKLRDQGVAAAEEDRAAPVVEPTPPSEELEAPDVVAAPAEAAPALSATKKPSRRGFGLRVAPDADSMWPDKLLEWSRARADKDELQALVDMAAEQEFAALRALQEAGVTVITEAEATTACGVETEVPARTSALSKAEKCKPNSRTRHSTAALYNRLVRDGEVLLTSEVHKMPGYSTKLGSAALAETLSRRFREMYPRCDVKIGTGWRGDSKFIKVIRPTTGGVNGW